MALPRDLTPTTWLLIAAVLLTKLEPYARLPPPSTAPTGVIFWPKRNLTLPLNTTSSTTRT